MQAQQQMVREFLLRHLGPDPDGSGWPTSTGIFNKWLLIKEEFEELTDSLGIDPGNPDEAIEPRQVRDPDEVKAIDAIDDLLYVIFNLCEELRINIEPFFNEVHRSNMTKTPGRLSPNKKILKGPDWEPPRIAEMLAAHRAEGSPVHTTCLACNGVGERTIPSAPNTLIYVETCGYCQGRGTVELIKR